MIDSVSNTLIPSNNINEDNIKKLSQNSDKSKDEIALKKACQDFESIFIHMMLKTARTTETEDALIPKSSGTKMFEDMYDQEIANSISTSNDGGIGIAKMLYEQMKVGISRG